MSITQLPQSTIKLITSSQIITSVSSAVKELIENALDAGASKIDVKLDNYGLDRIEVKDDGSGINPSNAVFMGLPHYTSKISTFSDIDSLESYGFRGEALNALCQVGNVTVTTATSEDTTGTIYVLDKNGSVASSKQTHNFKGTSIVVGYLFKDIPVRRQFCSNTKRAKEELRHVENIVKTLGVINPPVRFTLCHNKCMIWQKTSGTELRQGVVYMLGYTPARELQELKTEGPEMKIEALVPRIGCDISVLSKGSPDWSMVFINRRPVQCKSVYKIVCEFVTHHFGERLLQRKSPIFLVSFTLSPSRLDVNLEPNKTRVLIRDEDLLLEELRKLLTEYYGNPSAKEETGNVESPAKKRRIDASEGGAATAKPIEILLEKKENPLEQNGGQFEMIAEPLKPAQSVQPILPQTEVVTRRPSVGEKENLVDITSPKKYPSKPLTLNILDQSMTAEKWSMGHVKTSDGNFIQGPAVFVSGSDVAPPEKEKVQTPIVATSSMDSSAKEKEQSTGFSAASLESDFFSSLEKEFEQDFPLPNEASLSDFSVINPPPRVANCSEQLGPVISPPRARNEKNRRKTLQLVPKDDEIDMSVSSQMGRREFAGFTKFARDVRPQIILENPGIAFTKVAVILSDKWKRLQPEQREFFEEKARDHILARKALHTEGLFQPKLSFGLKGNPSDERENLPKQKDKSPKQKQATGPSKTFKSLNFQRSQALYRVSIDIIRERTQTKKGSTPAEEDYTPIGRLEPSGGWICLKGKHLSLISSFRLQEIVFTHRLLATHTIPLRPLSSPERLEETDLGADNWNLLLSMDRTICHLDGKTMVVSSPIIVKNGFRIQLSETENSTVVHLTHVADAISFYGIQDLLETLLLAATNGTQDVLLCRPLRVVNHIKAEAVRICRQDPSVMERQVLEELLLYWKTHLSPADLCLHSKPIWTQIHSISAT